MIPENRSKGHWKKRAGATSPKGQQAMALAQIYPDPEKGGRGKKSERMDETSTLFCEVLRTLGAICRIKRTKVSVVRLNGLPASEQQELIFYRME
jgi:hypothetical protein